MMNDSIMLYTLIKLGQQNIQIETNKNISSQIIYLM